MAKKTISIEIESSGMDLIEAVSAVVKAAKSGGSVAALAAGTANLIAVVQAIEALPADVKEDKHEFVKGVLLGAEDLVAVLLA